MENNLELIKSFETFYKLLAVSQNQGNLQNNAPEANMNSIEELRNYSTVQKISLQKSIDQTPILTKSDHKEEPKENKKEQNGSLTSHPIMIQTTPHTGK